VLAAHRERAKRAVERGPRQADADEAVEGDVGARGGRARAGGASWHREEDRTSLRITLIGNKDSGSADSVDAVCALLREAGAELRVMEVGEAERCDRVDDVDRVVVVGGDGSVGCAAALARRSEVPLAVVPAGTANDFARWLELPLDVEEAARIAADPSARTRTVELARAGGERPFVNAATAGLSVLAAARARPLKPRLGRFAYAIGALRAAVTGRPLHVTVLCDGRACFTGDAWQVVVAATGAFGGGSGTGGVDPHDHELDVAIVTAGSRVKLARRAWAMRRRQLVDDPGVLHLRGRTVEVDGARRFNVDGEVLDIAGRFAVAGEVEVVVR
jgi:diacylglycerol kinase family enzyme